MTQHNQVIGQCDTCGQLYTNDVHECKPYADMADICELAHILTVRECAITGVKVDGRTETGYSRKAQPVYKHFYNLITNTLKV